MLSFPKNIDRLFFYFYEQNFSKFSNGLRPIIFMCVSRKRRKTPSADCKLNLLGVSIYCYYLSICYYFNVITTFISLSLLVKTLEGSFCQATKAYRWTQTGRCPFLRGHTPPSCRLCECKAIYLLAGCLLCSFRSL